jgi:hypothetical protein
MIVPKYFDNAKSAITYQSIYHQASQATLVSLFAEAAKVTGPVVYIPAGHYLLSAPIVVDGINDLTIIAESGANIDYSAISADTNRIANNIFLTDSAARSALYFKNCARLKIYDLTTTGNSSNFVLSNNIGAGIYLRGCNDARIVNLRHFYGGAMFLQDVTATDFGSLLQGCYSFGSLGPSTPGPQTTFLGCTWELPETAAYDRIGANGSSHACYAFAGRNHCKWTACVFKNIRLAAIKISGSAANISNSIVEGNTFIDCGAALVYGADAIGDHDHVGLIFANNSCQDCATNRIGWHEDASVVILGSSMTKVLNNTFLYRRDNVSGLASATRGILITQQNPPVSPKVTAVEVAGNTFFTDLKTVTGIDTVINQCIDIEFARGVQVHHNHFQNQAVGVFTVSVTGLVVESNMADNTLVFLEGTSNITPIYRNNTLLRDKNTSPDAQLRSVSESNPVIEGNLELRNNANEGGSIPIAVKQV